MKCINKYGLFSFLALTIMVVSCQKMKYPALGDYPKDANPPGGPLKFFVAFDGKDSNVLMNAVDSIRANFPTANPFTSIAGVSGQAAQGDGTSYIKYPSANDFSAHDSSFTVAFWEQRNGIPNGNAAFIFTLASSNKLTYSMFALFDWGSWTPATKAKIKFYMADDNCACDNWFTWDSTQYINGKDTVQTDYVANVQDNNWHHIAFVYDGTTSSMTLYVDGAANPNVLQWYNHGSFISDPSQIQELDLGGNVNISEQGWGQDWDGGLDQFRFYGEALTADEVKALYTNKQ